MDCIFCKRAQGDPAFEVTPVVFEDGQSKAFYDLYPKAPVHVLLIPKVHIESIKHLTEHHTSIVAHLLFTAKKIAEDLGLKGYKLMFNVGREGGQMVDHLHLHILGGWSNTKEESRI